MQTLKFPKGFLWGAATAAHQVEGNNTGSDWWAFEHSAKRQGELISQGKNPEDFYSGVACDSYNRYEEDFTLAEHLGHNAHRLSIEWARLEPNEGKFDEAEAEHYEKVLQSAKAHGLTTFVTMHHYTLPEWFAKKGGFTKKENVNLFLRYASFVAKRLDQYTDFWITFNEPEVYSSHSYFFGIFPPRHKNMFETYKVITNIIAAHNTISQYIKLNTQKPVSMAYHLSDYKPSSVLGGLISKLVHYFSNEYILNRTIENSDFIGVNYYFHHHIGLFGFRKHTYSNHETSDLGWGLHPEGILQVLLKIKKYNKPIYITENGIADAKDIKREKYIKDVLFHVHSAILKGVNVKGYLHWSLLDNFEWTQGFSPRFGLIEIDRGDLLRRKVRYSAAMYAKICKTNTLEY